MTPTPHDLWRDASGLYVLGALDATERAAFEAHLAECAECTAEVRAMREVASALPYGLPQVDPPPTLRDRVMSITGASAQAVIEIDAARGAGPRSPMATAGLGARGGWLAMAALLLLTTALGGYGIWLRQRVGALEDQLGSAVAELRETTNRLDRTEQALTAAGQAAQGVQLRMAVLTAPDLRQVTLAGQPTAPRAAGRGFWSRSRGLLFAASELPPLPAGRTYQLWYLTSTTPISAGLFTPDQGGTVTGTFDPPPAQRTPTGLAVSLEPEGGVPAPTGAIVLAGTTTQ